MGGVEGGGTEGTGGTSKRKNCGRAVYLSPILSCRTASKMGFPFSRKIMPFVAVVGGMGVEQSTKDAATAAEGGAARHR